MTRREFVTYSLVAPLLHAHPTHQFDQAYIAQCIITPHSPTFQIELDSETFRHICQLSAHLQRVKNEIGFAHFNLLDFDKLIAISKHHHRLKPLEYTDTELLESLFYTDASQFGFFGEKVLTRITDSVNEKDVVKIPYTGHYLYKGKPYELYSTIRKEVGHSIVLTSGIRSIVKQMDLFLRKLIATNGNLRLASFSLAPAGYSYHSVGDFDVGKVGWGYKNFTKAFASTDEHKRLEDLGFIQIRYTQDNPFGVRYEPWHIKVV